MSDIKKVSWDEIKNKNFDLLVPSTDEELFKQLGYLIDKDGYLVNNKNERVKAEDGKEINIKKDKGVSLFSGSHIFVKNLAGYSQYLANKGLLRITEEKNKI